MLAGYASSKQPMPLSDQRGRRSRPCQHARQRSDSARHHRGDECSIETRERLSRILMNFRDRIRCVCIDNSTQRISTPAPELIIPKLTPPELEKVLGANFRGIPQDRLRAYAQYCDGSVRLAADMCPHFDVEIAQVGSMSPALGKTSEYYHVRLATDEQRRAVEAISLLKRVRHKGEAPTDL